MLVWLVSASGSGHRFVKPGDAFGRFLGADYARRGHVDAVVVHAEHQVQFVCLRHNPLHTGVIKRLFGCRSATSSTAQNTPLPRTSPMVG